MSFDHTIKKGQTSKVIEVTLRDSSTGNGKTAVAHGSVTASYVREGGTRTAITLASGTAGDGYSSGKWAEVDATNCRGLYQLHIPDAALATGADAVTIQLQASGVIDKKVRISLLDVDLRDATDAGLTNLDATISSRSSHAAPTVPTAAQIRSEIDSNSTRLLAIRDGIGWLHAQEIGATANPQTATAQYDTTYDGTDYRIVHSGLTDAGVRGTATLSKP